MKKLLATMLTATLLISTTTPAMAKQRVTCKSFKTQKQAQAYYNKRKKAGLAGWKSLDRDKDGKACDCLPGGNGKHCPKKKKR